MLCNSKSLFIGIALCLWSGICFAQNNNSINGLVNGRLDNGLTYYILHSDLQKGEASFYLVQKAGSVLENDDQNGLAHFLEHMAFNGSKHFPNGVSDYLKSQGVTKFNAYTSYDETVYNIDDVRATDPRLVDTCIYLLRDWCGDLLLASNEIDKERGVIEEEWRSKLNVGQRRQDKMVPYIFYNTKYAERNVIGNMDIIRNFKPKALRNFYKDWYRADMQAVIIVGDIDADEVKQKVEKIFKDLKVSAKAPKLPAAIHMEPNAEPLYQVVKDKEIRQNTIQLFSRFESNIDDYDLVRREKNLRECFTEMTHRKLVEFTNADQERFFTANIAISKLLGNFYATIISVTPFPGKDREALKQVLGVLEQIKRFGFTKEEVEKQMTIMYDKLETANKHKEKFKNTIYINKFKSNYFNNAPISGIEDGIDKMMESLVEIEAADVNAWVKKIDMSQNLVIEVDANENQVNLLSKEEILSTMDEVAKSDMNQNATVKNIDKLIDFNIPSGRITAESIIKQYDAKAWTLSNGAKVIYKYTDQGKGDFALYAHSFGGKSILDANKLPSANALVKLATKSGIYNYDRNVMMNYLRTKKININLTLDEINESLRGSASGKDADILFQFVHLFITKPRFDKEDFDIYKQKLEYKYNQDVTENPMAAVADSIKALTNDENDRDMKMGPAYLEAMNFESMKKIFNDAFSDAGDFTFYIIGDLDEQKAKDLVSNYIASLASNPVHEAKEYKVHNFSKMDKVIHKKFEVIMPEDKGLIDISYLNNLHLDAKEKLAMDVLVYTLKNRYFKTVREAFGGTYGVSVNPIISSFPFEKQQLSISFETDRNRVDELKPLIYKEINDIKEKGVYKFELQEALDIIAKAKEQGGKTKGVPYWLSVLTTFEERNIDISSNEEFDEAIASITPELVKAFAVKFFDAARSRDIVVIQRKAEVKQTPFHANK